MFDIIVLLFHLTPLALPYFYYIVPFISKELEFFLRTKININHSVVLEKTMFLSLVRVISPVSVSQTTLKLAHDVVLTIVPAHSIPTVRNAVFTLVTSRLKAPTQFLLFPQQPFQRRRRKAGFESPTVEVL